MPTHRERMLAGEMYDPGDAELVAMRLRARVLIEQFNTSDPRDPSARRRLIEEIFGSVGENIEIEPTLRVDYGLHTTLGDRVFMNFDCVLLDVCPIRIGSRTLFGPRVQVLTATHPMDSHDRATKGEYAKPITIGEDVWIGAGAIICPGVTIGDRAVIGAGSVVTRDITPDSVAVGVPARVQRSDSPKA